MQINPYIAVVVVTAGLYGAFLATRPEPTATTATTATHSSRPVSATRAAQPTSPPSAPRPVGYRWTDADGQTHYGEAPGDPTAVPVHGAISIYPAAELPRYTAARTTTRPTPAPARAVRTASGPTPEEREAARKAAACARAEADIARIRSRMRAGYTASQGNRLNEQERDARERRNENC
jgi:hypothetical protein